MQRLNVLTSLYSRFPREEDAKKVFGKPRSIHNQTPGKKVNGLPNGQYARYSKTR